MKIKIKKGFTFSAIVRHCCKIYARSRRLPRPKTTWAPTRWRQPRRAHRRPRPQLSTHRSVKPDSPDPRFSAPTLIPRPSSGRTTAGAIPTRAHRARRAAVPPPLYARRWTAAASWWWSSSRWRGSSRPTRLPPSFKPSTWTCSPARSACSSRSGRFARR